MPYIPNTSADQEAMLQAIGVETIEELFAMVPEPLRLRRPLDLPPSMSELELAQHVATLSHLNVPTGEAVSFLGAGYYDHFIPAVVDFVASRSEFYTAYTPYQAEASQGTLQAIFEYQTLICELTGMDVSNASMYDGATAVTEAVLMARAATRRDRIVVTDGVHHEYRQTLQSYVAGQDAEIVTVRSKAGATSSAAIEEALDAKTACVVVQHPNFFGCLEDVKQIGQIAHNLGALLVVVCDPISLGLFKRPADYGADLVVAEGQPLGIPLSLGGPGLGIMACRETFLRRMPGRLVGLTTDRRDKPCFVLTMQTREQHIRRERATSNICTNQGLMALRAAVYLAAMGPQGLRETAELCVRKARYAAEQLASVDGVALAHERPVFKEFVVRVPEGKVDAVQQCGLEHGLFVGSPLECWYPELTDHLLIAVTEKRTAEEIELLRDVFREALHG